MGEWLTKIIELIKAWLDLGVPPDVGQEAELRTWLLRMTVVLKQTAELSPTGYDDAAIKLLDVLLNDQSSWELLYSILKAIWNRDPAGPVLAEDVEVMQLATVAAVDPALIIAVVQAIAELLRWWRSKA